MAKAKAEALEMIKKLPDDVSTGVIMEELFFKQQVERASRTWRRDGSSHRKS